MVEARIVEAADGFSRDLGVKFGFSRAGNTGWGSTWGNGLNNVNAGTGRGANSGIITSPNISMSAASPTSSIAIVKAVASGALGLELSASEQDNRTKTISTPRVLTQDRQEAEIKQGYQVPYTTRQDNTVTTSFKDAVLSLKATPRITPDNKIILDIAIQKDAPSDRYQSAQGEPGLETKSLKTQAMIEDGGTLIVGGIYVEEASNTIKKVPLLGDLPVVGNLFKARSRSDSRSELLFFITPRIMGSETSVLRY